MTPEPGFAEFARRYDAGSAQLIWTTLVADLETPVSAMLKLADGRPYSFLLESVEGGAVRGRYSVIGLKPDLIWRCHGTMAEINRNALGGDAADDYVPCEAPPLTALGDLLRESRIDIPAPLPPMASGIFGYMGYDTVRLMERLPDANPDVLGIPDSIFVRPTVVAVFDNVDDVVTVITPVWLDKTADAKSAHDSACERLADIVKDFERPLPHDQGQHGGQTDLPEPQSNVTPEAYAVMVETAKEYIRAGDIFQVVPSQRFSVPFRLPPLSLYRSLRRLNPSPFLYCMNFASFSIVGSSPEILVRLRGGTVTIRPIAGTRPRGKTATEDQQLAAELLADPKERAEHLMLLDLGRNDAGRVAQIGTVKVTEQFAIERYSHVMHIVSNVEGKLDESYDALTALIAGFPAGTVSGAPKVRAMEIIDELECDRRGSYAGAVGYFGAGGDMDTCIALRTALIKDGIMHVQAGGGIVADSVAETEYQESCNKARALFRAAEEAVKFAARGG